MEHINKFFQSRKSVITWLIKCMYGYLFHFYNSRCVLAVIRHGDRTPKQKMKMEVMHPKFFEVFKKYGGEKDGHVKLKKPKALQEILDTSRELLEALSSGTVESEMIEEKKSKLIQIKTVLEMYGHFSGINRKVQLKYQPKGRPRNSSSEDSKFNKMLEITNIYIFYAKKERVN